MLDSNWWPRPPAKHKRGQGCIFLPLCITELIAIVQEYHHNSSHNHQPKKTPLGRSSKLFDSYSLAKSFPPKGKTTTKHQPHEFLHALLLQLQVQSSLTSTPKLTHTPRSTAIKFKIQAPNNGLLTHNLAFHARHTHNTSPNSQERSVVYSRDTRL
jgi:hypothetical protein